MDQSAEQVTAEDMFEPGWLAFGMLRPWLGCHQPEGPMRSMGIVVIHELGEDAAEVTWSDDQQMIEAFSTNGAHPAFGVGVGVGRPDRGGHDLGADERQTSKDRVNFASRSRMR